MVYPGKVGTLETVLKLPWTEVFDGAARLGFDGVELGVRTDYADTELWSEQGRRDLRARSQATNIPIASICLHTYWQVSFANPDPTIQAEARKLARDTAAIAAEVGATEILIPVTTAPDVTPEDARSRWIEGMRDVADAAVRNGVRFSLENVGRSFVAGAPGFIDIIDNVNSPGVGMYYDPGNAVNLGYDPLKEIPELGPRIFRVHVKAPGGTYLGEGKADWPAILEALNAIGYHTWYVFETQPTDEPLEAAERNLKTFRSWLAGN